MFDDATLALIAYVVFYAGVAWFMFGGMPRWAQVATGVAAVVLVLVKLFS